MKEKYGFDESLRVLERVNTIGLEPYSKDQWIEFNRITHQQVVNWFHERGYVIETVWDDEVKHFECVIWTLAANCLFATNRKSRESAIEYVIENFEFKELMK